MPFRSPLAMVMTLVIRIMVHASMKRTPVPSLYPSHSVGTWYDRNEDPFQNEWPAMDRAIAWGTPLGVRLPAPKLTEGDLS